MNIFERMKSVLTVSPIFLAVLLVGCSGGGGGGDGSSPASSNPTIVSGVVSKGLLNGSTVCAYAISGGAKGAQIGSCTTTGAAGNYQIDLGNHTGPVLFQATGGTYVNEATGVTISLSSPLDSMLPNSPGGNATVAVTALTEVAYQMANASSGSLTDANIQSAIATVQNNFGVADILGTMPVDALNVPAGATAAQRTYALVLATISQYLNGQTAGVTLSTALQTMQACLYAPATSCGNNNANVGTLLNTAMNTFIAGHPAFSDFSGMASPLYNFGSRPSSGSIVLVTVNPLDPATVGQYFSQSVVRSITPASRYTYSIDTLANGNGVPTGMTLDMNGTLSGTPFATGAANVSGQQIPHTYTFGVCATDTVSRIETTPCQQTSITVNPAGAKLTISKAGTGSGTVTPSSSGISCGTGCTSYTSGSSVTLTATPASGSTFTGWSGACAGTGACTVTMDGNKTVTATFTSTPSSGTYYWANWSCGSSSQCAAVMGAYTGSAGPMCALSDCNAWGTAYIPHGYACSTTATYTRTTGTPTNGVCYRSGVDF